MRVTDCISNNKSDSKCAGQNSQAVLTPKHERISLVLYELHWLLIEERVIFKILWTQPSPQAHVTKKLHRFTEVRGPEFHMFCISLSLVQICTY